MITERCLEALRMGATLAHALPLQLRLHHEGQAVAAVGRPPFVEADGARLLTPCAFRSAVGEAWRLHQAQQPVALCGLPDQAEPSISVGVPPGGVVRRGGIYQLPWPEGLLSVFAATACAGLTRDVAEAAGAGVHEDRVTGAVLVQTVSTPPEADDAAELLEGVLAAVAAEELIASTRH